MSGGGGDNASDGAAGPSGYTDAEGAGAQSQSEDVCHVGGHFPVAAAATDIC